MLRVAGAGRPGGRTRLAHRADLGLRPRRHAARLRVRPPLPRPGPGPRPRAASGLAAAPRVASAISPALRSYCSACRTNSTSRRQLVGRAPMPAGCGRCCAGAARSRSAIRSSGTTCTTATRTRPSRPPASTPPSAGPATLRRPHRHHQHPPVPPLRHRPLQPRPVPRRRAPARRLRAPTTCRPWRQLLNEGDYDYVVATRDRIEAGKPRYPAPRAGPKGRAPSRPERAADGRLPARGHQPRSSRL